MDLKKPKIKWEEESVAVKQNLNGMVSILVTMAICSIFGIMAYVFYLYNIQINVILLGLIISVLSGCALALVVYKFYKNSDKLLENVD